MQKLKIATACFLNENRELLVVRKKNTTRWMLPGGKLDGQETAREALVREIREELQVEIAASDLHFLGSFESVAANEANTTVSAQVFRVCPPANQTFSIAAEIAEMKWLSLDRAMPADIAPLLGNFIIPALQGNTERPDTNQQTFVSV